MANAADFYRGTTETFFCEVDMDLTDYTFYLSIGPKAGRPYFTMDNAQMDLTVDTSGETPVSTLEFTATQEQTLACKAGKTNIQLRVIKDEKALATDWGDLVVGDIIKDGVIHDDYDTD